MSKKTKIKIENTVVMSYEHLLKQVRDLIKRKPSLDFSMFETVEYGDAGVGQDWTIKVPNIFDKTPIHIGEIRFYIDYWRVAEDGPVFSPVFTNPTLSDAIIACNDLLEAAETYLFLENLYLTDKGIEIVLGS